MTLPLMTVELVEELLQLYPEVIYDPDVPNGEFLMKTGERRLVLGLKARLLADDAEGAVDVQF